MKTVWSVLLLVLVCLGRVCLASETKVEAPDSCVHCGMDRTKFGYSRMMVSYEDSSSAGTCSLNCVVTDLSKKKGKKVKSYQVADFNTKKLIDAKTASWVLGGSKRGVMSKVAKWAFADKAAAEAFIKGNGGSLATFDEVLKASEAEQAERAQKKPHSGHNH